MNEKVTIEEIEKFFNLHFSPTYRVTGDKADKTNRRIHQFSFDDLVDFCYVFVNEKLELIDIQK